MSTITSEGSIYKNIKKPCCPDCYPNSKEEMELIDEDRIVFQCPKCKEIYKTIISGFFSKNKNTIVPWIVK